MKIETKGSMALRNYFTNKKRIRRHRTEAYVIIIIGIFGISTIFFYTYITNAPAAPSDFPTINITSEGEINNDDYIDCILELDDKKSSEPIQPIKSKIKIRGRYNAELPKKGYRIELAEEISLLNMRTDDDWLLMAMYSDLNHMQIKLSFDLYRSLKPSNPSAILPDSEFVCLYINGDYQGLYLLMEKNDRRLFGLDDAQNNIYSSLIFQSSYFHRNFITYLNEEWEQDWPNEDEGIYIMDDIMGDLVSFVRDTPNDVFFDEELGVYSKFDKQNLIDFFVYNFFILHDDFWDHNYFIVRNTYPSKFFLVPWDFDRCFGQWLTRNSRPDTNHEEFILNNNELYNRLLNNDEFREECKARWNQLRVELWTEEFILDIISDMYDEIKEVLEIDSNKWYPWLFGDDWEERVEESIDWLFDWIPKRLEFCDIYFTDF